MTRDSEAKARELEARARELLGGPPLTTEQLAEKLINDCWHAAHRRAHTDAVLHLINERRDCSD